MITQEIKIHEESVCVYTSGSYRHNVNDPTFIERYNKSLEAAKSMVMIGDKVSLKTNLSTILTIESFIEKIDDATPYQGNPCVLWAKSQHSTQSSVPLRYSLEECDWTTLKRATIDEEIDTTPGANVND